VVRVAEVPDPRPKPAQVLIRVASSTVNSADSRIRGARFPTGFSPFARVFFGVRRPRRQILGATFAGTVVGRGDRVDGWADGERVCGTTGMRMGAHAELVAVDADRLVRIPDGVSDDDAAGALFGGLAALPFLRDRARVGGGDSVLVNGASGAVGIAAVQIAAAAGARVTGVTSTANIELVRRLGAEQVVDRTRTDVVAADDRYDVVFDAVGNLTIASGRGLLAPGGRLVLAVATLGQTVRARGNVMAGPAPERVEDVRHLLGMVVDGTVEVVVDRTYGLDEIVEAHRLVDSGHKVGTAVVRP